jgi:hypothetical protein
MLLCILHLAAYRPVIFVSFFFIIFTLVWRTSSSMYIDLAGPVLSTQTVSYIGPGLLTPLHVLAYLLTLLPFFFLFRQPLIDRWLEATERSTGSRDVVTLSDLTFVVSVLFVGDLFVDLFRNGAIPLFAHMERFVYTETHAGPAHRWLIRYGNMLCFWWGIMFAAERLRNRRLDIRYIALFGALMLYMFLTGNRFSAFYSFGSFFVMSLAAVIAVDTRHLKVTGPFYWIGRTFRTRHLLGLGAGASLIAVLIVIGIYNNLANVRGYQSSEILSRFLERTLIQPSELAALSYDRVFTSEHWRPYRTFDFLFQRPLDADRNTTPQYLMLESIGEPRTYEHISGGFQFAGGFPEIFFELFGPTFGWLFLFAAGYIAAALTALIIKGVIQGRYASAFLSLYVLYGFYVMYIGGMLNFVTAQTYWMKIAALAAALAMEWSLARADLPLLPWVMFPSPKFGRKLLPRLSD